MASFKSLISTFLSILLAACASTPPRPDTAASEAQVSVHVPDGCRRAPDRLKIAQLLSGNEEDCTWFGNRGFLETVFEDESGIRLDLYCRQREYALIFVASPGYTRQVGRCPWGGGKNQAEITHSGDNHAPDGIDCIIGIFWRSEEPRMLFLGYPQGDHALIDWKEFQYAPGEDRLVLRHFKSPDGPGGKPDILVKKKISHGNAITADILNFNPEPPMNRRPMRTISRPFCDVDRDGDCDAADMRTVQALMGQCEVGLKYNTLADLDHDGCITAADGELLLIHPIGSIGR